MSQRKRYVGRGSQIRPPNRFATVHLSDDGMDTASTDQHRTGEDRPEDDLAAESLVTKYLPDNSQSLVTENDSPDVGFRYSVNPYRGCAHGCSYCYARPTHEYLGLDAGLDFETRILVKHRAPELLRDWLCRSEYQCEPIMFSGVTDCYQPAEREFRLTQQCLAVAAEAEQPISIVTKNALVTRDLELLRRMAAKRQAHVALSITTLDQQLSRVMEPRTSSPTARLAALRTLAEAGVPTQVMMAPIIPGLNDHEIPAILQAAREHGASAYGYVMLRLPLTVRPVFLDWLAHNRPYQNQRVRNRIQAIRDGGWNDTQFGRRMSGSGVIAEQIRQCVRVFATKYGYGPSLPELNCSDFRPPRSNQGDRWLF